MKACIFFILLVGLTSCDFYYYDAVYDARDRILGRYEMEEYSETFNDITRYEIWIERSNHNGEAIWIDNFYAVNLRVRGTYAFDKITIPRQTINGYEVEGVGTVYGGRISFRYRVKDTHTYSPTDFLDGNAWKTH